jgi:hypothetical protein
VVLTRQNPDNWIAIIFFFCHSISYLRPAAEYLILSVVSSVQSKDISKLAEVSFVSDDCDHQLNVDLTETCAFSPVYEPSAPDLAAGTKGK